MLLSSGWAKTVCDISLTFQLRIKYKTIAIKTNQSELEVTTRDESKDGQTHVIIFSTVLFSHLIGRKGGTEFVMIFFLLCYVMLCFLFCFVLFCFFLSQSTPIIQLSPEMQTEPARSGFFCYSIKDRCILGSKISECSWFAGLDCLYVGDHGLFKQLVLLQALGFCKAVGIIDM